MPALPGQQILALSNMEMKLKIPLKQPEFVIVRQVNQPYKTS